MVIDDPLAMYGGSHIWRAMAEEIERQKQAEAIKQEVEQAQPLNVEVKIEPADQPVETNAEQSAAEVNTEQNTAEEAPTPKTTSRRRKTATATAEEQPRQEPQIDESGTDTTAAAETTEPSAQ